MQCNYNAQQPQDQRIRWCYLSFCDTQCAADIVSEVALFWNPQLIMALQQILCRQHKICLLKWNWVEWPYLCVKSTSTAMMQIHVGRYITYLGPEQMWNTPFMQVKHCVCQSQTFYNIYISFEVSNFKLAGRPTGYNQQNDDTFGYCYCPQLHQEFWHVVTTVAGWHEGHPVCRKSCTSMLLGSFFGWPMGTRLNLPWSPEKQDS